MPVKALLARQGGGYALELVDGGMVSVEPGMYADDMVEVEGSELREGLQVVTRRMSAVLDLERGPQALSGRRRGAARRLAARRRTARRSR